MLPPSPVLVVYQRHQYYLHHGNKQILKLMDCTTLFLRCCHVESALPRCHDNASATEIYMKILHLRASDHIMHVHVLLGMVGRATSFNVCKVIPDSPHLERAHHIVRCMGV